MANRIRRDYITYVRDGVDTQKSRMYAGGNLVSVPGDRLTRAYEIITTLTSQHLNINIARGVSHRFHFPGNVDSYVYGPNGEGVQHIKIYYDAVLPLLLMLEATGLPLRQPK